MLLPCGYKVSFSVTRKTTPPRVANATVKLVLSSGLCVIAETELGEWLEGLQALSSARMTLKSHVGRLVCPICLGP